MAASSIAAVDNQARTLKIGDRGKFHTSWSVKTKVHAANTIGFYDVSLGHRKLIGFKHSYIAKLLLNDFAERLEVDADGEAYQHDEFREAPKRVDNSRLTSRRRQWRRSITYRDTPRYRTETDWRINHLETFKRLLDARQHVVEPMPITKDGRSSRPVFRGKAYLTEPTGTIGNVTYHNGIALV